MKKKTILAMAVSIGMLFCGTISNHGTVIHSNMVVQAAEVEAEDVADPVVVEESSDDTVELEVEATESKVEVKAVGKKTKAKKTSKGDKVVQYALRFVGNPYRYGGTSLTKGIDCSGFVRAVYGKFGVSLPRTSYEQSRQGKKISSISKAKPGDLVRYSGHIGIYMGNGKLVHASNRKDGIKVSNVRYRRILGVRRIVK